MNQRATTILCLPAMLLAAALTLTPTTRGASAPTPVAQPAPPPTPTVTSCQCAASLGTGTAGGCACTGISVITLTIKGSPCEEPECVPLESEFCELKATFQSLGCNDPGTYSASLVNHCGERSATWKACPGGGQQSINLTCAEDCL